MSYSGFGWIRATVSSKMAPTLRSLFAPYTFLLACFSLLQFSWTSNTSSTLHYVPYSLPFVSSIWNLFIFASSYFVPFDFYSLFYSMILSAPISPGKIANFVVIQGSSKVTLLVFFPLVLINFICRNRFCKPWNRFAEFFDSIAGIPGMADLHRRVLRRARWKLAIIYVTFGIGWSIQIGMYFVVISSSEWNWSTFLQALPQIYNQFWPTTVPVLGMLLSTVLDLWAEVFHLLETLVPVQVSVENESDTLWIIDAAHRFQDVINDCTSPWTVHLFWITFTMASPILFGVFVLVTTVSSNDFSGISFHVQMMLAACTFLAIGASQITFVLMCQGAEDITKAHLKLTTRLGRLRFSESSSALLGTVQNYVHVSFANPAQISLNGYITLNNGFLTSLFTTALTYLVFLIQFNG